MNIKLILPVIIFILFSGCSDVQRVVLPDDMPDYLKTDEFDIIFYVPLMSSGANVYYYPIYKKLKTTDFNDDEIIASSICSSMPITKKPQAPIPYRYGLK